jgi:hypothetical protein
MSISGNQLPSGYLIPNRDIPPDVMEVCQLQATEIWPIAFNVIGIH